MGARHGGAGDYVELDPPRIDVEVRWPVHPRPPGQDVDAGGDDVGLENLRDAEVWPPARESGHLGGGGGRSDGRASEDDGGGGRRLRLDVVLYLAAGRVTDHRGRNEVGISDELPAASNVVGQNHPGPSGQFHRAPLFDTCIGAALTEDDLSGYHGSVEEARNTETRPAISGIHQRKIGRVYWASGVKRDAAVCAAISENHVGRELPVNG